MSIFDLEEQKVPEYYPYMYKDDFTPEQILSALHKKMMKDFVNKEEQSVKIESEIKIK